MVTITCAGCATHSTSNGHCFPTVCKAGKKEGFKLEEFKSVFKMRFRGFLHACDHCGGRIPKLMCVLDVYLFI